LRAISLHVERAFDAQSAEPHTSCLAFPDRPCRAGPGESALNLSTKINTDLALARKADQFLPFPSSLCLGRQRQLLKRSPQEYNLESIFCKLKKASNYCKWFGARGLYFMLQNKLSTAPRPVKVTVPGIQYPVTLRLKTSDLETYGKIFAEQEYCFEAKKAPKVIVDAGANIGLASVFFANAFPDATIIAVEPEQTNFLLLRTNVAPYKTIIPIQAALWGENARVNVVDLGLSGEWGKWEFQTQPLGEEGAKRVCHQIQGLTLDRIMRDQRIDYVDVLKIDIEGAEKEVFANAPQWIDKVGILIIELHEHLRPGCNRTFSEATSHFPVRWRQGESLFIAQEGLLAQPPGP
jgi:FkbM family methyltransferase